MRDASGSSSASAIANGTRKRHGGRFRHSPDDQAEEISGCSIRTMRPRCPHRIAHDVRPTDAFRIEHGKQIARHQHVIVERRIRRLVAFPVTAAIHRDHPSAGAGQRFVPARRSPILGPARRENHAPAGQVRSAHRLISDAQPVRALGVGHFTEAFWGEAYVHVTRMDAVAQLHQQRSGFSAAADPPLSSKNIVDPIHNFCVIGGDASGDEGFRGQNQERPSARRADPASPSAQLRFDISGCKARRPMSIAGEATSTAWTRGGQLHLACRRVLLPRRRLLPQYPG